MSDKQNDTGINKVENKIQKKSEKDRNGVIGGLVIGGISIFVAYQIYIKLFEFPIGKMLVYIVVFWAIICFNRQIFAGSSFRRKFADYKLDEPYSVGLKRSKS